MTVILQPLLRFLRTGAAEDAPLEEIEHAFTRNATLLISALAACLSGLVLLALGSPIFGSMAFVSGVSNAVALVLSVRGHPRIGAFMMLLVCDGAITATVTATATDQLAVAHIFTVCVPFSLFRPDERSLLLAAVGIGFVGMCISTIPLVPSPWLPNAGELAGPARALATIMMSVVIVGQLWFFFDNRARTLRRLSKALTEAKEASVAKSAFLANMSHEIRTPINGVLGMIGILEGCKLEPVHQEYVQTARTSGLALLDVINDILDLSKVEAGQLRLEPLPFELRSTMEDILDQFAYQSNAKGLELMMRYVPGTPEHVMADAGRIRQVVTNLVGNAIKFTDRGHVLLTVEQESSTGTRATLRISVEDTGPGIPSDRKEEVFDKFRQLDGSATRQHTGTGLGLAITRELTHLMGGEIGLSSEVGRGSTFWLTLPVEIDQEAVSVRRSLPEEVAAARVLVVDDHPVNRRVLREQIASWRMHHDECDSGEDALLRLLRAEQQGQPFDIAVLDYQMPHLDGLELAKRIKAEPALTRTVLILLTSVSLQPDVGALESMGIAGYLVKPVHHSELADVLAAALHARNAAVKGPLLTRHLLHEHRNDEPTPERYEGLRVLVVEDNAINQKVACRLLERLGCRVDIAGNGQEAVDLVDRMTYDLLFMDVQMPVMDGFEATRALRGRGYELPIIAMTAHAMQGDRERCLAAGMNGYVSKPVQRKTLAHELAKLISPR